VKTLIIIQARMNSTRLPNKVMLPLAGAPLLQRMIERVQAVSESDVDLIVATTNEKSEEPIRALCKSLSVKCFDGHPTDLLERHYEAAKHEQADVVVKIPSDCPLIDPIVIAKVLRYYRENIQQFDYVSNLHPATYPDGNDVEVMSFATLEYVHHKAKKAFEREHTTPYIWERPEKFRIGNVLWESGLDFSMSHRWTIDYPEDYYFIKTVYDELWRDSNPIFSLYDILALMEAKPEIQAINGHFAGVNWYRNHIEELRTITATETKILL